jgi:hypothetical protein
MTRAARQAKIAARAAPELAEGEQVVATSVAWAARVDKLPLLFQGRHLHALALTDARLLVFARRPRETTDALFALDAQLESLRLERARGLPLLYQVLVHAGDRRLVFEFRLGDHATGRTLAQALEAGGPA